MQLAVRNLAAEEVGAIELDDAIYGVEVRRDILHRVVLWQLAKRRSGTSKVKTRAEIARTGAKIYKQKGTGRARHGSRRANIFRGGGVAHGPHPRDYSFALPRKVRMLGLKCALASKVVDGKLMILDEAKLEERKTKLFKLALDKLGLGSVLIITGPEVDANLRLASRNLPHVDVLPAQGLNVYDILRRDSLVLTREALRKIEERFHGPSGGETDEGDDEDDGDISDIAAPVTSAPAVGEGAAVSVAAVPFSADGGVDDSGVDDSGIVDDIAAPVTSVAPAEGAPAAEAETPAPAGSASVLPTAGVAAAVVAVAVGVAAAAVAAVRSNNDDEERQS